MSRPYAISVHRLLYPIMWICALSVIVLSIVGTASITGWMPQVLESGASGTAAADDRTPASGAPMQKSVPAFQCVECGVIGSVRDIERRSAPRLPQ